MNYVSIKFTKKINKTLAYNLCIWVQVTVFVVLVLFLNLMRLFLEESTAKHGC